MGLHAFIGDFLEGNHYQSIHKIMHSQILAMAPHAAIAAVQVEEAILGLRHIAGQSQAAVGGIAGKTGAVQEESSIPWAPIMKPTGSVVFACT